MLRTLGKWVVRIIGVFVGIILLLAIIAALMPVPTEAFVSDEESGAGSVAVTPSYSGLQREFPALNQSADNQSSAERVELGRQLFFDPLLSAENDLSCAHCHHPDLGLSNGLPNAPGRTTRNVSTLWNVGYNQFLLWDGSVSSLEEQAIVPLTHPNEMAADLDQIASELATVPAYVDLFDAAYGSDSLNETNIRNALSTFQRSLVTNNSPFDQYAAGNFDALTPQQRRGLALFRSGATRCFECHTPPTFGTDTFRVIGVESDDLGRAGITEDGVEGAFRVPTLRNVALSGPYMHNGSMETLEEVVDFYADGGGRVHGAEFVDPFVAGFDVSEQEKADLVAFLHALTDESNMPEIPEVALSGLPTIEHIDNPVRGKVKEFNSAESGGTARQARDAMTFTVSAGESVQSYVDQAQPGDTILIEYGEYNERVVVDVSGLTIEGIPNADGDYPIFDGGGTLAEAIIGSGNDFSVGNLHIRNYDDNAILIEGVNNVHFYDLITEDTGTYGVYPTKSTGVLVERVTASGVNDAAIYAGQCRDVVIRDSVVFDSVIGIELENTINGVAYNNHAYNNSLGIFVVVLPQLNSKVSRDSKVYDNLLENNNHPNFADEGMAAALVPPGVGILSLGADDVEIYNNTMTDHRTSGVAVFSLTAGFDANEIDVGPNPENNWVYDNTYSNNGYDPVEFVADLGIPVGDILWDGSGWNNRFDEDDANAGFPVILPRDSWPTPLRKIHFQALQLLVKLAG